MVIVVVDDVRSLVLPEPATYARNYDEAIALLDGMGTIDELWLDHDLGVGKNGYDLALWLEQRAYEGNPIDIKRIIIHSYNPWGARRMSQALEPHYPVSVAPLEPEMIDRTIS